MGAFGGRAIGSAKPSAAPNKVQWTWVECADRCTDDERCVYFLVSKSKGCVLKSTKGKFTPNTGASVAMMHGDCPNPALTAAPQMTRLPTSEPATPTPERTSTATPPSNFVGASECIVLKRVGKAYAGRTVAQFNNADGAEAITDTNECAAKCKEDLRCVYFSVNKGKSKGCSLKSTRRGSALSSTAYLGHGTCTHAVPPTCKVMETGKGDRNFMKNPLATFLSVINAVRCVLQGQACQLPMCSLATSCPAPAVA